MGTSSEDISGYLRVWGLRFKVVGRCGFQGRVLGLTGIIQQLVSDTSKEHWTTKRYIYTCMW